MLRRTKNAANSFPHFLAHEHGTEHLKTQHLQTDLPVQLIKKKTRTPSPN
jgi:hypothetical protein